MPHDVMEDDMLLTERLATLRWMNKVYSDFSENPSAFNYTQLEGTMRIYQHLVKTDRASVVRTREENTVEVERAQLETKLRAWRRSEAEQRGWPPYRVFTETSLRDLLDRKPTTIEGLREVTGFGPKKVELFGNRLIELISPITG